MLNDNSTFISAISFHQCKISSHNGNHHLGGVLNSTLKFLLEFDMHKL